LPRDPEGTTDRVQGGVLRVGIMHEPPWTVFSDSGESFSGIEVTLVERLAGELDARIQWRPAGESQLMELLKNFEIDLVIGGLVESSAWNKHVGLTRAYIEAPFTVASRAEVSSPLRVAHVLAVPPGKNKWLLTVERFLERNRAEFGRRVQGGWSDNGQGSEGIAQ
jgi:ABC-type amino acid transport substrate-binding protein